MRTPFRFEPSRPVGKPVPFRSVTFFTCIRCMGHGYFHTDPPEVNPAVAFSLEGAYNHLLSLLDDGRINLNQFNIVATQIDVSGLPIEIPPDVQQKVGECLELDEEMQRREAIGQERFELSMMPRLEVAEVVHEYLLASPDRPELRLQ